MYLVSMALEKKLLTVECLLMKKCLKMGLSQKQKFEELYKYTGKEVGSYLLSKFMGRGWGGGGGGNGWYTRKEKKGSTQHHFCHNVGII